MCAARICIWYSVALAGGRPRRRGLQEEGHPRRQSTPRRRLLEAQLADKVFVAGTREEKLEDNGVSLTPRLMRSSTCVGFGLPAAAAVVAAEGDIATSRAGSSKSWVDCSAARPQTARPLSRDESFAAIVATAREVATESLLAGTRNVALLFHSVRHGSQSTSALGSCSSAAPIAAWSAPGAGAAAAAAARATRAGGVGGAAGAATAASF